MPTPKDGEKRSDFVSRCIPIVMEDGTAKDNKQAVAICNSMYKQSKKEQEPEVTANPTEEKEKDTHEKMYDDAMPMSVVIEPYINPGPTTLKEMLKAEMAYEAAEEMQELTGKFKMVVDNIMASDNEDKEQMLIKLAGEFAEMSREVNKKVERENPFTPKEIDTTKESNEKAKSQLIGDSKEIEQKEQAQSDMFIWKEGNTYKWIAAYSNNRRDNDNPPEIISSESHKAFDEGLNKGIYPMPELWLWHIPYPVGITKSHTYDNETGFPMAGGEFYPSCNWAAEGIIKAGWNGVSHGMPKKYIRRDENDPTIITHHATKEITLLPQWAAANKLSFHLITKEAEMTDEKELPAHKREEFIKAFGEDKVLQMEAALTDKAKEADEAGIEKKEETKAEEKQMDEKTTEKGLTQKQIVESFIVLKEQIEALTKEIAALKDNKQEEKETEEFDLVSFLKSKSVIGAEEAKIDGRSTLAKDKPEEADANIPVMTGLPFQIGLVDRIVNANQKYAGGK